MLSGNSRVCLKGSYYHSSVCNVTFALTATVKDLDASFVTWCTYHLNLFDVLIVWVDDASELNSSYIPNDARIHRYLGSQLASSSAHTSLLKRQAVNATNAVKLCHDMGFDWLCHIDSDELVFAESRRIFERDLESSCGQVKFRNHEVCSVWAATEPFYECTDFKLNGLYPFNFYTNGKAIVRCNKDVLALHAHDFLGYSGVSCTSQSTVILHYACPTFERWLRKYSTLGEFSDFWWDDQTRRIELKFHLGSRDACRQIQQTGDTSGAEAFYRSHLLKLEERNQLILDGRLRSFRPLESVQLLAGG